MKNQEPKHLFFNNHKISIWKTPKVSALSVELKGGVFQHEWGEVRWLSVNVLADITNIPKEGQSKSDLIQLRDFINGIIEGEIE